MGEVYLQTKVSVIIPAYNAEKTLKRCLDSVFAQDLDAFEVILVNDGSTDGTLEVARNYEKCPNFVLIDQQNRGVSRARWSGVSASKGKYIGFVDADDYIEENMFSCLYETAENDKADIVVCNFFKVEAGGKKPCLVFERDVVECDPGENISRIIIDRDSGSLWNKLWRKDRFKKEFFERSFGISYGEDLLISFLALIHCERVAIIEDPLYFYVLNDASVTSMPSLGSLEDNLLVLDTLLSEIKSINNSCLQLKMLQYYVRKLFKRYSQTYEIPDHELQKDLLRKRIKERIKRIPIRELSRAEIPRDNTLKIMLVKMGLFDLVYAYRDSFVVRKVKQFVSRGRQ